AQRPSFYLSPECYCLATHSHQTKIVPRTAPAPALGHRRRHQTPIVVPATSGALPPAISCPGASRTPAVGARGRRCQPGVRETFTASDSCAAAKPTHSVACYRRPALTERHERISLRLM